MSTFRTGLTSSAVALAAVLFVSGCAVTRGQQSTSNYVGDAATTTSIKARFVESKMVDAASIHVETLNGAVILSGFAKNAAEKAAAERTASGVEGVKSVRNAIVVRP